MNRREHQHSYSKYELVNMASVRLKSPLRLTPDAKALSFELSCAVALSSLIGRMPGERLTSAAEAKVPLSLWQSAAADARMRSLGGIFGARGGAGFALRFRICETNRLPILETYRQYDVSRALVTRCGGDVSGIRFRKDI
jgi:hypothetical protein